MRILKILMTLIFGLGVLAAIAVHDPGPAPGAAAIVAEARGPTPMDSPALVAVLFITITLLFIVLRSPGRRATTSSSTGRLTRRYLQEVVAPWAPPEPGRHGPRPQLT